MALIAILIPVILLWILKYVHPVSHKWIMGYVIGVSLVFKESFFSLWLLSKLKLITFLQGLTLTQGAYLLVKRWFLDNVLGKWVKLNIIDHLVGAANETKEFYLGLNFRAKLKSLSLLAVAAVSLGGLLHLADSLGALFLFAELKLVVESVLKGVLAVFDRVGGWVVGWFTSSWLAPVFQVFALSYLLQLLERWFGPNNPATRFFNFVGSLLNSLLSSFGLMKEKHFDPLVEHRVVSGSKRAGERLSRMIRNKKIQEEYRYFERFEQIIMNGHIDAYHSFKGMEKITDKRELYKLINRKTCDNIDIVAYVSRNDQGGLLEESVSDDFYHDIFLLEGFASHQDHGVKIFDGCDDPKQIDHTDFWVLNTSRFPVSIGSMSGNFDTEYIPGNGLRLIKTNKPFSYDGGDVYCEYEGVRVAVAPVERYRPSRKAETRKTQK